IEWWSNKNPVFSKDFIGNAAQESSFYSRANAVASCGTDGYGVVYGASSHRGFSTTVSARAGRYEGFRRHAERRAGAGLFGHGRDGGVGFESDVAGRQGFSADCRKVRRALDRAGQGVWLRRGRAERPLWADVFAG